MQLDPPSGWTTQRSLLWSILLPVIVVAVYLPAINGAFVWDDDSWSTRIADLLKDGQGLWRMWTDTKALQQYYPLTGTSFWLEYQQWGYWTTAWHLDNVLLHVVAALLFRAVLAQWQVRGAWIAAWLFALHPMMVESVAWITERKNVLSQVFALASVLAYGRFADWGENGETAAMKRSRGWWAAAFVFFLLAMLAKVSAFVVAPALLLVAWWLEGRGSLRRQLAPLSPFFLVALVLGVIVMGLEQVHVGARELHSDLAWWQRGFIATRALWFYAGKLLVPWRLSFVYPEWDLSPSSPMTWLWPLLSAVVIAALLRYRSRIHPGAWVAIAFFVLALLPVLGLVNVYGQRYSWVWDHWVYLPSLAFFAVVGSACSRLVTKAHEPLLPRGLIVVSIAGLALASNREAGKYIGPMSLWRATLEVNPQCWMAYNNMGDALQKDGRFNEAASCYQNALAIRPTLTEPLFNLAGIHRMNGDNQRALECYQRLIALAPGDASAHNNLGSTLLVLGKPQEALEHFEKAVRLSPGTTRLLLSLGVGYAAGGRAGDAVHVFTQVLASDPSNPVALQRLAWIKSTAPDSTLRDGAGALALVKRLNAPEAEIEKGIIMAAALAETGDTRAALAIIADLANRLQDKVPPLVLDSLNRQREVYARGEPFRDPSLKVSTIR